VEAALATADVGIHLRVQLLPPASSVTALVGRVWTALLRGVQAVCWQGLLRTILLAGCVFVEMDMWLKIQLQ